MKRTTPLALPKPMFLTLDQVCALTTLTRTTIFNYCRDGHFPAPYQLGGATGRRVGWRVTEVLAWADKLTKADFDTEEDLV
jgi:predicted DNA-binding transcriptional regulator AlpA